jgi:hypothetical protein
MKNINQVLKENMEEFDKKFGTNEAFIVKQGFIKNNEPTMMLEDIKQFLTQSNQNLISAFKEMVENWKYKQDNYMTMMSSKKNYDRGELARDLVADLLSSLTEENI